MLLSEKNKAEHDSVSQDEKVLRRILKNPEYYKPGLPIPIQYRAFYPTKEDEDGLSLFRELFTTAGDVAKGKNPKGYAVARLLVAAINELDLTVLPDPQPQPELPGHSLIPELNYNDKEKNKAAKRKFKDIGFELAKIAGRDMVLE